MAKGSGGGNTGARAAGLRAYGAANGVRVTVNKNYFGKGKDRYVVEGRGRRFTTSSAAVVRSTVRELR